MNLIERESYMKGTMLEGKICLITGANRGIGKAILELFAAEGATIYANARSVGSLDDAAEYLQRTYECKVYPVYFDVRDSEAIKAFFLKLQKKQGRLDVLVNNAGIMKDALIGMASKELMRDVFETNVFAAMEILQFASRMMKRKKSGSIINFSSVVGVNGVSGQMVYSASKGAVISMTKSAAKELAPFHIRVNAVAPGMTDTDLIKGLTEEQLNGNIKKIGWGRLGAPEDSAKAVLFYASDMSEYVTGQILGVDGSTVI